MTDRCLRCHRPTVSDPAWWGRQPVPEGSCLATGSVECEEARDERYRRMERVCEAARVVTADGGSATDGCGCEWCALLAALRALDGDAP